MLGARLAETGLRCSLSTSSHFTAPALCLTKIRLTADRAGEEGSGLPVFFGSFLCSFQPRLSEQPEAALCYVLLSLVLGHCFCQCLVAG